MITRLLTTAATLLVATIAFAESPFISNDIKYKDNGSKPAAGRSGNASIEARALLGKDGLTAVEVSSNGTLEKVQVKLTDASLTRNFNNLGTPAFNTTFDDLGRGEPLQIQANVSDVDPSRTGVVTVDTTVARRPDLTVASVSAPPHGYAGGPFRVHAVVRELNGDTGARASCVLSVNGMDADRADNIWVDAGGTVTCTFAPNFTSAGEKNFAVRVENVRPSDDDTSNDSAAGSTTIYDGAEEFQYWTAQVQHGNFHSNWTEESWWYTRRDHQSGWQASHNVTASVYGNGIDFPNVKVSFWEYSNGQLIQENLDPQFEFFSIPGDWWDEPARDCAIAYDNHRYVEMCETPASGWFQGSFWIQLERGAGDVTYRSNGWDRDYRMDTPPGYWTWNYNVRDQYGLQTRLGDSSEFRLVVSDGSTLWEANGSVALAPRVTEWFQPKTCRNTWRGESCYWYDSKYDMLAGSAWGVAGQ
jgi:hypothetical protein